VHLRTLIKRENKQIFVTTNIAPSLPLVLADSDRITQILTNLLDNAFHYTLAGGSITVRAHAGDHSIFVSIDDTGFGLSEEEQGKIFSRFYRSGRDEVQQVPGTGLGLAIVRSLVEMHGGDISVESVLDEGSTFSFSLPRATTIASIDTGEDVQNPSPLHNKRHVST
jgi:two-component system sensor histidine kinase ResE